MYYSLHISVNIIVFAFLQGHVDIHFNCHASDCSNLKTISDEDCKYLRLNKWV